MKWWHVAIRCLGPGVVDPLPLIRVGCSLLLWSLASVALGGCGRGQPPDRLERPNILQFGLDGSLLVGDFHHHRIAVFEPDGRFRRSLGQLGLGPGQLWRIWGVLQEAPDEILVLNQRVTSLEDSSFVWEIKKFKENREIQLVTLPLPAEQVRSFMAGPELMPDGSYLVADMGSRLLLRYSRSWQLEQRWAAPVHGPPFGPISAVRRRGESYWIVEEYRHRIRQLSLGMEEQLRLDQEGQGPGQLFFPSAVDVCPGEGWFAVTDMGNARVQRFDRHGRLLDEFAPPRRDPATPVQLLDLLVTPDCQQLYLLDSKGSRLLVTSVRGELRQVIGQGK